MSTQRTSLASTANAVSLDTLSGAQKFNDRQAETPALARAEVVDRFSDDPGTINRIKKILTTTSRGVPAEYENAWHWAGAWVAENGVTLPPDTTELRSLRNWFCYQVNSFKKGRLSDISRSLLEHYNIDLALYRAPNTGRGTMLDDDAMVNEMLKLHSTTGSFTPQADAAPELLEWQRRLLECFMARGTSGRMRTIASKLPGFSFGAWLRPGEAPVPTSQDSWWATAQAFKVATAKCPAFRGVIDTNTPKHLATWATDQITAASSGRLSPRQRGELLTIGILTTHEHKRSAERAEALMVVRAELGAANSSQHDRDLNTFLGTALLVRLIGRSADLKEIYSTLGITPIQYSRILQSLAPVLARIADLQDLHRLNMARQLYKENPLEFNSARSGRELPDHIYQDQPKVAGARLKALVDLLLEARETLRAVNVRQTGINRKGNLSAH